MTRVVIFGARGMLGTDLVDTAPAGAAIHAFGRSEVDVTDSAAIARIIDSVRPDWVLNASAYTQVDRAEADFDRALAVNGTAVGRLGELCASRGTRVVHFSTDYVFRGDATRPYGESDPVDPVNAYGRSKLAGEHALVASGAQALILRTQWLYGRTGRSFPRTMWDRATNGSATRVVADQFGRPTFTVDLAHATWALVRERVTGLYHVANTGDAASWYDVASVVFDAAGASDRLSACTTAEYPTPAVRPAYSVLDTTRLARETGVALPPWRDALHRFIALLGAERPAGPIPESATRTAPGS